MPAHGTHFVTLISLRGDAARRDEARQDAAQIVSDHWDHLQQDGVPNRKQEKKA
jgi:hypothetical protein